MADIFELFKKISKETAPQTPIAAMVVGLGNPGIRYQWTRHNAGFLAIDALAERYGCRIERSKFQALVGEATISGKRVLLMKPQTFMNNSGNAVTDAANFYKLAPSQIIVLSDDIALDVGKLRVRKSGSAGGQKGLNSIIEIMGSQDFPRIRIGVGQKPSPDYELADWVLSVFTPEQREHLVKNTCPLVCDGVEKLLAGDIDGAMQHCNGKGGM
ncbi:MAG: aminoacyl-tRNA hydrolase [Clostridia bacterium]|nr:aminoacyl-tRNA hydrolase [Clostridia bacterium]